MIDEYSISFISEELVEAGLIKLRGLVNFLPQKREGAYKRIYGKIRYSGLVKM